MARTVLPDGTSLEKDAVLKRWATTVDVLLMNLSRGVEQLESLRFEAVNPTVLLRVRKPLA